MPGIIRDRAEVVNALDLADAAWLRLVRPIIVDFNLGADNDYGHPDPETLALLGRAKIPLLRTDRDGTITIVSDGETWKVVGSGQVMRGPPARVEVPDRRVQPRSRAADRRGRIDLNTATQAELESLPGIGPALAKRIIEGRPYRSVDDVMRVKGIGAKKLEEIRGLVGVR